MSTSEPFVYRFIGSNLKNFFLGSARARELKETRVLHNRARAAYEQFPLGNDDERTDYIAGLVLQICEETDRFPCGPLLQAICQLLDGLFVTDGLTEFPEPLSLETLSAQQGFALRDRLRRVLHLSENWQQVGITWRHKATVLVRGILDSLPASVFREDAKSADVAALMRLSVPLVALCDDAPALLERTMATMYDDEVVEAGLFDLVRTHLERNLCAASGIPYENRVESSKAVITPSAYRANTHEDRVRAYLSGTPFADFFETPLPFAIPFPARFEHTHIVGGSGHGKTQLMQLLIHHDLTNVEADGRSIVVIDSQGDLIRTISNLALFNPRAKDSLADRLIIIDPNDVEYPACLNVFDWNRNRLAEYGALERERLLNSTVELYEYFFGALLGAELTQRQGVIFRYIARLMMEIPNATIQTLRELMENGQPFRPYMERLPGSARSFFETRFFDRSFNETKKQILTRLWGVLSNATLERMFSHPKNKVDIYDSINSGKIILINTAKDLLKQDGCAIFGRFFIALIAQAAIERATIKPHERRPAFVYIDEAQDYFDDNVGHLLNQARKFRVGMIFAHQNLDQLSADLRASVMASTSIKLAGGISAKDARVLADELRCDEPMLLAAKKRRQRTEFACHVRNFTPQAVKLTVPLGFVESLPTIEREDYFALLNTNRDRYAVSLRDGDRLPGHQLSALAPAQHGPSQPSLSEEEPVSSDATIIPSESAPAVVPTVPRVGENASKQKRSRPLGEPPQLGRGGRQHKYIQELLKRAGQERGYFAVIEETVLDGAGKVDVSLTKNGCRIACEISVSTGKDWELGNVEKCLVAGYDEVLVVASNSREVQTLAKFITAHLDEGARERVRYLTPGEVISYLDQLQAMADATDNTVKGYKVKVTRRTIDHNEADERRRAISAALARSVKRGLPDDVI